MDLALNNQQRLISQQTKPNQKVHEHSFTSKEDFHKYFDEWKTPCNNCIE